MYTWAPLFTFLNAPCVNTPLMGTCDERTDYRVFVRVSTAWLAAGCCRRNSSSVRLSDSLLQSPDWLAADLLQNCRASRVAVGTTVTRRVVLSLALAERATRATTTVDRSRMAWYHMHTGRAAALRVRIRSTLRPPPPAAAAAIAVVNSRWYYRTSTRDTHVTRDVTPRNRSSTGHFLRLGRRS